MYIPSVEFPTDKHNFYIMWTEHGKFWFSYKTIIAFQVDGDFCIRENDWNTTTGGHLNYVDPDHSLRISGVEFEARLAAL